MFSAKLASWKNERHNSLATAASLVLRKGTETHDWGQNWTERIWKNISWEQR